MVHARQSLQGPTGNLRVLGVRQGIHQKRFEIAVPHFPDKFDSGSQVLWIPIQKPANVAAIGLAMTGIDASPHAGCRPPGAPGNRHGPRSAPERRCCLRDPGGSVHQAIPTGAASGQWLRWHRFLAEIALRRQVPTGRRVVVEWRYRMIQWPQESVRTTPGGLSLTRSWAQCSTIFPLSRGQSPLEALNRMAVVGDHTKVLIIHRFQVDLPLAKQLHQDRRIVPSKAKTGHHP